MTYKELAAKIGSMTEEQQNSDVTIVDMYESEGYGDVQLSFIDPEDDGDDFGLDDNHPFLYF